MKIAFRQAVALGFLLLSLIYVAFILSLESTTMIGDDFGYDPGSRVIPLVAGAVMAMVSLHLVIQERSAPAPEAVRSRFFLLLANVGLSIAFIALFRPVGYLLSTGVMMFCLSYLNLREVDKRVPVSAALPWLAFTAGFLVFLYFVSRAVVKACFALARAFQDDFFREPFVQALAVIVVLVPLFAAVGFALRRLSFDRRFILLAQTSVGTTMTIYVVFRQMFLVHLPKGILFL